MIGLGSPVAFGALLRAVAVVFSLAAAAPASSLAQDEGLSILPSLGGDGWPDRGDGGLRQGEDGDGRGADEAVAPGAAGTSDVIAVGAGDGRAPAPGEEGPLWAPPEAAEGAGLSGGVGPGRPDAEAEADGSSSLLGYLEESDEVPPAGAEPELPPVPGLGEAGAALFGCPRSVLQGLLKAATAKADVVSSLEIEREVLTLCGERQRLVVQILTAEAELVRLWRESLQPAPAAEAEPAETVAAPAFDVIAQLTEFAGAPVLAFEDEPEPEQLAEAEPEPEPVPRYWWASIFGVSRDLKARVSDGAEVWFVRVGDELPGGVVVDWIGVSPPAVHVVTGDEVETLPYRASGGGEG